MKISVTKKELNNASKGIKSENTTAARAIKNERKSLRGALAYLAISESDEAATFRAFLDLKKNAGKKERDLAANYVIKHYINAARVLYVSTDDDACYISGEKLIATNNKGKEVNDYLDVIRDIKTKVEVIGKQRRATAEKIWKLRNICICKDTYNKDNKVIDTLLNECRKAPEKSWAPSVIRDIRMNADI